ncbi:hypothetical protein [Salinispora arenicola]|uniref:Uncharacterized protein n=1 Tax=Salinispora arenicola (strain CNS-205) TaxID=391037 RepID=A8LUY2_SALAI|nr:hypothetical protein [Salinispora arenicola]MCN0153771.1 hypothetical protein [Salinispora arenicola]MCN0178386.1 hypothetical protein [Salinispora arenicola]NIL40959.1 hypothetical protein [Salinispora arenicola]NIL58243.1 hypothetical protein [Salinispora arenicola]NIL63854.1 hypothetical protein [Salinispora arenicola]
MNDKIMADGSPSGMAPATGAHVVPRGVVTQPLYPIRPPWPAEAWM